MKSINEDLSKKDIVTYSSIAILILFNIFFYWHGIKPKKEKLVQLKSIVDNMHISSTVNDGHDNNYDEDLYSNVTFDNENYDNFYSSLINISDNYKLDYISLSNEYINEDYNNKVHELNVSVDLEFEDFNVLGLLFPIINERLINFKYLNDDSNKISFEKIYFMDQSYSQKDLVIDYKNNLDDLDKEIEESLDEDKLAREELIVDRTSKDFLNENKPDSDFIEQIISFGNSPLKFLAIPMSEGIVISGGETKAPIINETSYLINMKNNGNEVGYGLFSFKDFSINLFINDCTLEIKKHVYDYSNIELELVAESFNGEHFNIKGIESPDSYLFSIQDNIQLPISIKGLKFTLEKGESKTIAFKDLYLKYSINVKEILLSEGFFATIERNDGNSIDDFLSNIGGNIEKEEFLKDNSISEAEFFKKRLYLVRFRKPYEIKTN